MKSPTLATPPSVWHEDVRIQCKSCGCTFLWTGGEQAFFAKHGYPAPKRCPNCRRAKHTSQKGLETPKVIRLYK